MDYLEKRRHSLDKDEVKAAFATLVEFYTLEWLTSDKGHAIQTLWKRKDYMATNELYALAISIQKLSCIDLQYQLE